MVKKLKVIVVGHITLDEFNGRLIPGGSAYYCSQTYLALGAEVKLISIVGEDFHFNEVFSNMSTYLKRSGKTTQFKNIYKKDSPREQISLAQAEAICPNAIPEDFKECDVLHLVPVLGEVDIHLWASFIRAKFVAVGLQGWLRRINDSKKVLPKKCEITNDDFRLTDIVVMSEDDIKHEPELLDRVTGIVPLVALTHGARGYDLFWNGKKCSYGVYSTLEVDPTGAGDVFATGLVFGLSTGKSDRQAGFLGAGLASVIIEDQGGKAFDRITEGINRAGFIEMESGKEEDWAIQLDPDFYSSK